MSEIIGVLNQKGGVGKTTTIINLSYALSISGKKVLIVDMDPQGNATSGIGIDKNIHPNVYDMLISNIDAKEVIKETDYKNLYLIPSNINLAGAEIELVSEIARETKLKRKLDKIKKNFDFIFIDSPPSLGLLTMNIMTAADSLIIPIQCEYYALEGVSQLLDVFNLVKESLNSNLIIKGILLTMYNSNTNLSLKIKEEVEQFFKELVFKTIIPRNVKIAESPSFGKPVIVYNPKSKGAIAYKKLAEEVLTNG